MTLEYKAAQSFTTGIDGRSITGIFAVHGNIDAGNDRTYPGLFGDFKAGGRSRVRFLWQHDSSQPPIAAIDQVFEVARADLPPAVLEYAPNATGGTAVTRTYLEDDFADRVFGGVRSSALSEMSYAYDAKDWKFSDEGDRQVRDLFKAEIFDISDVLWGMNPATVAAKRMPLADHSEAVLAAVADFTKRLKDLSDLRAKEGRVLSGENRKRITDAVAALKDASRALDDLLAATEPQKSSRAELNQLRAAHVAQQQRLRELGVRL